MPIRIKAQSLTKPQDTRDNGPEFVEIPFENRVTVVDGQEFHWAHNQERSFADDGVGRAHATSLSIATIVEDNWPHTARS